MGFSQAVYFLKIGVQGTSLKNLWFGFQDYTNYAFTERTFIQTRDDESSKVLT